MVEIIGPPGVGKTSVYEALCSKWQPGANWIYMEALAWQMQRKGGITDFVQLQLHRYTGKLLKRSLPVDLGVRFSKANQTFAELCWQLITESGMQADLRIRAAYFLFQDFSRYQAAKEDRSNRVCVVHEGLMQKSFLLKALASGDLHTLASYFEQMPQPHAIFYLNVADPEIILKRLRSRKKTLAQHQGKTDDELLQEVYQWQQLFDTMTVHLHEKGIPIYHLDAAKPIGANVAKARKILGLLNTTQVPIKQAVPIATG